MIMVSDDVLFGRWRGGDSKAGTALFARYYEKIDWFFARKNIDAEIEELVQETFARCVASRERIHELGVSFRAYLFGIARRVLWQSFRRRYRCREEEVSVRSILDLAPGPVSLIGRQQDELSLLTALQRLPLKAQVMLELRYWESMSSAEIEHVLDIPAPTVRGCLCRARKQLEQAMRPGGGPPASPPPSL